jgi:hypothetical protein
VTYPLLTRPLLLGAPIRLPLRPRLGKPISLINQVLYFAANWGFLDGEFVLGLIQGGNFESFYYTKYVNFCDLWYHNHEL